MARRARLPAELMHGPFTVAEARRAGLARWHLEGKSWRRLRPGVYAWAGLSETATLRLEAARRRLPEWAAFSGMTAAWLHGLEVASCGPIEVVLQPADLHEVVVRRGFRTVSLPHALFDLSRRLSMVEAVVITDMALHARMVDQTELQNWIRGCHRRKGVRAARRVFERAEQAAESPMESRLRMLLVLGGLPRPQLQVPLHDSKGRFLGRPDLYYPDRQLGIEYDGETHRASLIEDDRRQNRLVTAGIRLLRFTASDVLRRPDSVLAQVRDMLVKR